MSQPGVEMELGIDSEDVQTGMPKSTAPKSKGQVRNKTVQLSVTKL